MGPTGTAAPAQTTGRLREIFGQNPPWMARSVWLAALLIIVGAIFWLKGATQTTAPVLSPHAGAVGFAQTSTGSGQAGDEQRSSESHAPLVFRFGISYLAGYFLGWASRRFLRATMIISGGIILLLVLAKKLGWVDLDWSAIEGHARHTLTWAHRETGAVRHFVTGYLPSAGMAGVGVFLGFRRR